LAFLASLPEEHAMGLLKSYRQTLDLAQTAKDGRDRELQSANETLDLQNDDDTTMNETRDTFDDELTASLSDTISSAATVGWDSLSREQIAACVSPLAKSPMSSEAGDLRAAELLIQALSNKSDFECSSILARLRTGERWRDVIEAVLDGSANDS
jgi:hypothetical protein